MYIYKKKYRYRPLDLARGTASSKGHSQLGPRARGSQQACAPRPRAPFEQ